MYLNNFYISFSSQMVRETLFYLKIVQKQKPYKVNDDFQS